mgnify:CR=1 FL=1
MNRHIKKFYRGNPLWHDLEQEFSFCETDFRVINRNNNSRFDYQDIVAIIVHPITNNNPKKHHNPRETKNIKNQQL